MVGALVPSRLKVWVINFQLYNQQVQTHAKQYSKKSSAKLPLRKYFRFPIRQHFLNKMLIFFTIICDIFCIYIKFSISGRNCNSQALCRFLKVDDNFLRIFEFSRLKFDFDYNLCLHVSSIKWSNLALFHTIP